MKSNYYYIYRLFFEFRFIIFDVNIIYNVDALLILNDFFYYKFDFINFILFYKVIKIELILFF